jgi:hypothetical protein
MWLERRRGPGSGGDGAVRRRSPDGVTVVTAYSVSGGVRCLRRSSRFSVVGSPRQCSVTTSGPAFRRRWRRIRTATTASSSGPRMGMNSGIRSMGDANQTAPTTSSAFEPRGTRGSRERPLNRTSRLGSSSAISLAAVRRPIRNSPATALSADRARMCLIEYPRGTRGCSLASGSGGLALEVPAVAGRDWLTNEAVQLTGSRRGVARKRCDAHDPPESGVPTAVLV